MQCTYTNPLKTLFKGWYQYNQSAWKIKLIMKSFILVRSYLKHNITWDFKFSCGSLGSNSLPHPSARIKSFLSKIKIFIEGYKVNACSWIGSQMTLQKRTTFFSRQKICCWGQFWFFPNKNSFVRAEGRRICSHFRKSHLRRVFGLSWMMLT